jgi:acyl carrier protein
MKTAIFDSIRGDIANYLAVNYDLALDSIAPDATLEDVGFDSLGVLAIATMLENKYGLSMEDGRMASVRTFSELMELVRVRSAKLC